MTVSIVCTFHGGPVAVFLNYADAHAYVQRQPGRFNNYEIEEMEVDAEKSTKD
jgi:hypothetical protein